MIISRIDNPRPIPTSHLPNGMLFIFISLLVEQHFVHLAMLLESQ